MKSLFKITLAACFLAVMANRSYAQIDFDTFLEAGIEDANTLLESYMEPAFVGFGIGMNSGWYNTAKPHKFLGFDLNLSISAAKVPDSKQFFTFRDSDYSNVRLSNPSDNRLPTLFGPNLGADDLPELTFLDPGTGQELVRITGPTGLGIDEDLPINAVPVPMIQLGVGLFKGTEVKLRYIPEQNFDDNGEEQGSVKLFGIGVMHDIKSLLPADKLLPFDLSLFVGYTALTSNVYVDAAAGQFAEFDASALTAQVVASKKLAIFTAFAGVGYAKSDIDFGLKGNYTTETTTYTDPINFNFSNSGLRANVGFRLRLLIFNISGEYAIQEYNTYTLGFGVGFR